MARIAGIRTEKDLKGNITSVTFDLKKHAAKIMPILVEMGAIEEDDFEKEWKEAQKTGYTPEEFRKAMYETISKWEWKK
jgi:hypothetical protein